MRVKNSIGVKLAVGFGFCILLLAIMVGLNFTALQSLEKLYRKTLRNATAAELASDAQHIGSDLGVVIGNAIINRDMPESDREWATAKEESLAKIQKLAEIADTQEEQDLISQARAALVDLIRSYEQEMLPIIMKGGGVPGPISDVDARLDTRIEAISLALERMAKIESDERLADSREFHTILKDIINSGITISLVGLMAALLMAILTTRRIVRPLSEVTRAALDLAEGNYRAGLDFRSDDETGVLASTFRIMAERVEKRTLELEKTNEQLRKEIADRKQVEEEVRVLNASLEQRVAERTADLAATVATLQKEVVDRTKAEEALFESEKLMRVVIEILPVGIWVTGRGGEAIIMSNRASKMIWCGKQYCDIEMTGDLKGWWPGSGARLEKDEWALARSISRGETTLNQVVEIECFDGSRKIISNSAVPILNSDREIIAAVEVIEDITESTQAAERLRASHEQLRNFSIHLEATRENERTRIAREVHDELGQLLTVLKFDISWLNGKIPGTEQALIEKTGSMIDLIDTTIRTVQRISTDLRPGVLDNLGLGAAIEWYAQQFQARTGIVCRLDISADDIAIDAGRSTAMFRIFQEAMTNILRHADASLVVIVLKKTVRRVQLKITDDGTGISGKDLLDPKSVGLIGMRERAANWSGKVSVKGVRGKGTTVTVTIPLFEKE